MGNLLQMGGNFFDIVLVEWNQAPFTGGENTDRPELNDATYNTGSAMAEPKSFGIELLNGLGGDGDVKVPFTRYSPEKIFSGAVPAFDVNFIDPKDWSETLTDAEKQEVEDAQKVLNDDEATEEELNAIAHRLAKQITKDYEGKKLLLVGVLKGSIYFFTDLTRYIDLPCNIDFIQASSYGAGTVSSGNIQIIKDIADDLTGFDVLLVEDILDTGNTLKYIHDMLSKRNPESIGVVTLLDKPARRTADIKADYVGVDVPDAFVVGYGLDYDQYYRNLPYIGVLKKSIYEK